MRNFLMTVFVICILLAVFILPPVGGYIVGTGHDWGWGLMIPGSIGIVSLVLVLVKSMQMFAEIVSVFLRR